MRMRKLFKSSPVTYLSNCRLINMTDFKQLMQEYEQLKQKLQLLQIRRDEFAANLKRYHELREETREIRAQFEELKQRSTLPPK